MNLRPRAAWWCKGDMWQYPGVENLFPLFRYKPLFSLLLVLTSQSFVASVFELVVKCPSSKYFFDSIDSVNAIRGYPGEEGLFPSDRRILTRCWTTSSCTCLLSSTIDEKGTSTTIRKALLVSPPGRPTA